MVEFKAFASQNEMIKSVLMCSLFSVLCSFTIFVERDEEVWACCNYGTSTVYIHMQYRNDDSKIKNLRRPEKKCLFFLLSTMRIFYAPVKPVHYSTVPPTRADSAPPSMLNICPRSMLNRGEVRVCSSQRTYFKERSQKVRKGRGRRYLLAGC